MESTRQHPNSGSFDASPGISRTRKKRRRKPILGLAPRLVIVAVVGAFAILLCCAFVAKVIQPYQMQHQEGRQIHALNAQLDQIDSSNTVLLRRIAFLKRPDGVATAARAQGFLKPGEVSLVINAKPPLNAPTLDTPGFSGMIQRAWRNLTNH